MAIRKCLILSHDYQPIQYICTHPDCKIMRYICSQCLFEQIHMHGEQNLNHVMDQKKLKQISEQNFKKLNSFLQSNFSCCQKIIRQAKTIINQLHQLIFSINDQRRLYQQQIETLKQNSFTILDQEQIMEVINQENLQINLVKSLSQLRKGTQKIDQNVQKFLDISIERQNYVQKIQNARTLLINQDQTQEKSIQTVTVSQDLQYIVSGGSEKILKIWDYNYLELLKEIPLENSLLICKFTNDSKFLFVGISGGTLYQLDVAQNFRIIYDQKVHPLGIVNFYCITNFIIVTTSWDKTIAKVNSQTREYLFQFQAHNDVIYGLDYHIQKRKLITCSDDKSFKIWKENQLFLENPTEHRNSAIKQILFIQDKDQLIHLDNTGTIKLWQIHFKKRQLQLITIIADKMGIFNISLVFNQLYILGIGNKQIQIYSLSGQQIKYFDHQFYKLCQYNQVQLDTMKAIIVKGEKHYQIFQIKFQPP